MMKRRWNVLVAVLVFCLSVSLLPIEALAVEETNNVGTEEAVSSEKKAEEPEESFAPGEDDPGAGRLSGNPSSEFYGSMPKNRAADTYKHDSRFDSGYTIQNGIDVSKYNGKIDWEKAKKDGVQFAIIRVAYRGYGKTGSLNMDPKAYEYLEGAAAAGIPVGVYIFSQAITEKEAVEEADYILDAIKGYKISLPVVMDYEYADDSKGLCGRLYDAKLSRSKATNVCLAFMERVTARGYTPMLYANSGMLSRQMYADQISSKYQIWLAHYTAQTNYAGDYNYWQYSSTGKVDGISGNVDMNFRYIKNASNTPIGGTNITSKSSTFDSVKLTWGKVPGVSGYRVYRYDSAKKTYSRIKTLGSSSTSYTDKGLNAGKTYKYKVRAYRDLGSKKTYGAYSQIVSIKTKSAVKGTVKSNDVNVRKGAGKSYKVLKKVKKSTRLSISGSTGNWYRTSVTVKGKKRTGYILKKYVRLSSSGSSSSSSKVGKTSVKLKAAAFNKVKLTWKKVSGASGYQIQRYSSAKKKYVTVKTITKGSTVSYTNGSLNASTTYKYRVRAYKKSGSKKVYGSWSTSKKVKTKGSRKAKVKASDVNVRKGAGTSYKSLKRLKKGSKLKVIGSKGGWYKVSLKIKGKTQKGYVLSKYIKFY